MTPEDDALPTTETLNVEETNEREAIIFIPAIGRGWDDPSIEGVAKRMAVAIDRQSKSEKSRTHVEVAEHEFGVGYKCKMFTITKTDDKTARPLIDIYGMDYSETLVENYAKRSLFTKTLLLTITLIDSFIRWLWRFFGKRGKSMKEKIQLGYGLLVSLLLVAYLAVLIAAVAASFEELRIAASKQVTEPAPTPTPTLPAVTPTQQTAPVTPTQQPPQTQTLPADGGALQSVRNGITWFFATVWSGIKTSGNFIKDQRKLFPSIIVLLTALGFILPTKVNFKEKISTAATNYLCLIHYLKWGERNHAIGGKLESLLEYLVEKEKGYEKIHIIGYSFGSIVALDNLFPTNKPPTIRFGKIDTLVTIGCPFDIIRSYWANYFKGRHSLSPDAPKWINVYSPIDILSSNFADAGNDQRYNEAAQKNIGIEVNGQIRRPENIIFSQGAYQGLGVIDILTLAGFKAHAQYWGEDFKGEITCFHSIVEKMYSGTSILN